MQLRLRWRGRLWTREDHNMARRSFLYLAIAANIHLSRVSPHLCLWKGICESNQRAARGFVDDDERISYRRRAASDAHWFNGPERICTFHYEKYSRSASQQNQHRLLLIIHGPFVCVDESWWEIQESADIVEGQHFAVVVCYFVGYYPRSTPAHDAKNIRAMVIGKHTQERFHVRSYLMLSKDARHWV